jgi:hypothetical protein
MNRLAHGDASVAAFSCHWLRLGPGDDDDDEETPIGDPPDDDDGDDRDDDDDDDDEDEDDDEEPMQLRRCASPHRQRARIAAQCRPDDHPRGAVLVV